MHIWSLIHVDPARTHLCVVAVLACALASACEATPDPIEGEDRSVFSSRVRASLPLGSGEGPPSTTLDLELSRQGGSFSQTLDGVGFIQLDDVRIPAPADVETEFTLATASVLVHHRLASESRFSAGFAGGLGVTRLDLEVSSGTLGESDVRVSVGLVGAGELAFRIAEELEAFSRLTLTFGSPQIYLSIFDVGASWRPLASLSLSAGWQFGYYELTKDSDARSDIEIRASGPFVTLAFGPRPH